MNELADDFICEPNMFVSYRVSYKCGFKACHDLMLEDIKKLLATLERLTRVGMPSKSCSGAEWANQALIDNCEIASQALQEYKNKWGEG